MDGRRPSTVQKRCDTKERVCDKAVGLAGRSESLPVHVRAEGCSFCGIAWGADMSAGSAVPPPRHKPRRAATDWRHSQSTSSLRHQAWLQGFSVGHQSLAIGDCARRQEGWARLVPRALARRGQPQNRQHKTNTRCRSEAQKKTALKGGDASGARERSREHGKEGRERGGGLAARRVVEWRKRSAEGVVWQRARSSPPS